MCRNVMLYLLVKQLPLSPQEYNQCVFTTVYYFIVLLFLINFVEPSSSGFLIVSDNNERW